MKKWEHMFLAIMQGKIVGSEFAIPGNKYFGWDAFVLIEGLGNDGWEVTSMTGDYGSNKPVLICLKRLRE